MGTSMLHGYLLHTSNPRGTWIVLFVFVEKHHREYKAPDGSAEYLNPPPS